MAMATRRFFPSDVHLRVLCFLRGTAPQLRGYLRQVESERPDDSSQVESALGPSALFEELEFGDGEKLVVKGSFRPGIDGEKLVVHIKGFQFRVGVADGIEDAIFGEWLLASGLVCTPLVQWDASSNAKLAIMRVCGHAFRWEIAAKHRNIRRY